MSIMSEAQKHAIEAVNLWRERLWHEKRLREVDEQIAGAADDYAHRLAAQFAIALNECRQEIGVGRQALAVRSGLPFERVAALDAGAHPAVSLWELGCLAFGLETLPSTLVIRAEGKMVRHKEQA